MSLGTYLAAALLAGLCQACAAGPQVAAVTLRADLLQAGGALLAPAGLTLDAAQARVATSRPLGDAERFEARALWSASEAAPALPLVFELTPASGGGAPLRATLSAPLLREVLVPVRRAGRGEVLGCDALEVQARPLRQVPPHALRPPCALPADAQTRRVLLAGEVLRDGDVQVLPEVVAQAPVQVRVVVGRVALEKPGIALADARQGETVRVSLPGSARTLSGRVVARNLVVMEGSE